MNVDKAECGIDVGFVFRGDGEISPMEFVFRKVSKVILELLEAEPRFTGKSMISVDVGLVWVHRGRRGCRHEDE